MRLLGVELLRLRSRRAALLLVLVGLVGALLMVGASVADSVPPSDGEIAAAQALADREREQPYIQQEVERCKEIQADAEPGEQLDYPLDFECDDLLPTIDSFLYYEEPSLVRDLGELVPAIALMLALVGALLGATFAGADWSAGTVGTHLLFEPRRGRVFASKAGAVTIGVAVPAVVAIGAAFAATWWAADRWGTTSLAHTPSTYDPMTGEELASDPASVLDLVWLGGRGLLLVLAGALGGYLLAMACRSSLGAVGAVAAYAIVGETLLRAVWSGSEPWLLSSRVAAFVQGGFTIYDYSGCTDSGEPCEPVTTVLSTLDGGLVVWGLVVAGLLVAYALFRRRDVT